MRERITMLVTVLGAALGWAARALQLLLTLDTMGAQSGTLLDGVWRYLGYFTVIANLFAAGVLSLALSRPRSPRLEFAAVTAMVLVGLVYSLLLRDTWNPQGWQKIADIALHDAMPLVVVAFWLLRPHGGLHAKDVAAAVILPLGYCAFALARGAMGNWYAYGFLDVARFGAGPVALNCAGLGLAFVIMAAALARLDRSLP